MVEPPLVMLVGVTVGVPGVVTIGAVPACEIRIPCPFAKSCAFASVSVVLLALIEPVVDGGVFVELL